MSQSAKQHDDRFRALGNMGDVLIKMSNVDEALKVFAKQLILSKQLKNKKLEAIAFGSLGVGHRIAKQFDKSLGFHTQVRKMSCEGPLAKLESGNTKGGSITVPLTSYLTGLD